MIYRLYTLHLHNNLINISFHEKQTQREENETKVESSPSKSFKCEVNSSEQTEDEMIKEDDQNVLNFTGNTSEIALGNLHLDCLICFFKYNHN